MFCSFLHINPLIVIIVVILTGDMKLVIMIYVWKIRKIIYDFMGVRRRKRKERHLLTTS